MLGTESSGTCCYQAIVKMRSLGFIYSVDTTTMITNLFGKNRFRIASILFFFLTHLHSFSLSLCLSFSLVFFPSLVLRPCLFVQFAVLDTHTVRLVWND